MTPERQRTAVRSEAEDERRSREQSLPLRQTLGKCFSVWISWQRGHEAGITPEGRPRRGEERSDEY